MTDHENVAAVIEYPVLDEWLSFNPKDKTWEVSMHLRSVIVGIVFAFGLLLYCSNDNNGTNVNGGNDADLDDEDNDISFDVADLNLDLGADVSAQDADSNEIEALNERIESLEAALVALHECPDDMIKVSDFCIERDDRPGQVWGIAGATCLEAGRRLCSVDEIFPISHNNAAMNEIRSQLEHYADNEEWTSDFGEPRDGSTASIIITIDGSQSTGSELGDHAVRFRCCMNVVP